MCQKYLVAGLGNIGAEYAGTRHNIGFSVLDALAKASNTSFTTLRYGSMAQIRHKGRIIWLLKPSTYMNLSGNAVSYWVKEERIPLENLLVILDDTALPFGKLRMRKQGSDGGHNGLKSINLSLNTTNYARLRVGVGDDFGKGQQADYVLGHWTKEQEKELPFVCNQAMEALFSFVCEGVDKAMNHVNTAKTAE